MAFFGNRLAQPQAAGAVPDFWITPAVAGVPRLDREAFLKRTQSILKSSSFYITIFIPSRYIYNLPYIFFYFFIFIL